MVGISHHALKKAGIRRCTFSAKEQIVVIEEPFHMRWKVQGYGTMRVPLGSPNPNPNPNCTSSLNGLGGPQEP